MCNNDVLLHLSLLDGVGPVAINKIVGYLSKTFSLDQLYCMLTSDVMVRFGLTQKVAQKIVLGLQDRDLLEKEKKLIDVYGVKIVTLLDSDYPSQLQAINVPPPVLYYRGKLFNERALAVVGSRKANLYGLSAIKQLLPDLIMSGVAIVSGGAIGLDTLAHKHALQSGGKTIAVLGSGLLCPYPASNRRLFEDVVASGGAVISSFPLKMGALPGNFPARNRIISGLSDGCLVVQAAQKSGALITARYALEQGRNVYAVPGPIDCPLSAGCNRLVQEGATLVSSAEDIINDIPTKLGMVPCKVDHQVSIADSTDLNDMGAVIKNACRSARTQDELMALTGLSIQDLQSYLLDLQLEGCIEQDFMGSWRSI